MPLSPGSSSKTKSNNIKEMMDSGYPQKQAVAASLSNARRHPSKGKGVAHMARHKGRHGGRHKRK